MTPPTTEKMSIISIVVVVIVVGVVVVGVVHRDELPAIDHTVDLHARLRVRFGEPAAERLHAISVNTV